MAERPDKPALPAWLTFERLVSILAVAFAAGSLLVSVQSLEKRTTKLEEWRETTVKEQADLKAQLLRDIGILLERTDPKRNNP